MRTPAILFILSAAFVLCAANATSKQNSLTVHVAAGPFAGTYSPPGSEIICLHAKAQRVFSAAWKSFQAKSGKSFTEGGVEVSDPDAPGKKRGTISLTFLDPAGHSTTYSVSMAPVAYVPSPTGAVISFEGSANSGVHIKINAACMDVTRL